ncbi:hypothetical protein [Cecembia lonarensis]|uniref:Uncharacterized protein n=1 Tax=Cecembia lonarensis (strain CCUG 58316 / KCTC 22772 / LW9) TaxID=1225176 RepID=K1LT94_CECL9|nr:hypothetical protein [Cecembia lonarensis]EKB47374.1 hypothetical protein B879_04022 [Cecembia lonarensis LW9]
MTKLRVMLNVVKHLLYFGGFFILLTILRYRLFLVLPLTDRSNRHPDPDGLGEGSPKANEFLLLIGKVTYKTTCPMH